MAATPDPPAGSPSDRLTKAADRLRESARWIVISAGAAAAAVIAGINFSSIGSLTPDSPDHRFVIGWLGAIAGLVGVIGALGVAMNLAAKSSVVPSDLAGDAETGPRDMRRARRAVAEDAALAPWDSDFGRFRQEYRGSYANWKSEFDRWACDTSLQPNRSFLDRADLTRANNERIMTRLLAMASYLRLESSFQTAKVAILGLLLLGGAGLFAVTWAANPPAGTTSAIKAAPLEAILDVPSTNQAAYRSVLGAGCRADLDALPVIVLSENGSDHTADVLVALPSCHAIRRTVAIADLTTALKVPGGPNTRCRDARLRVLGRDGDPGRWGRTRWCRRLRT